MGKIHNRTKPVTTNAITGFAQDTQLLAELAGMDSTKWTLTLVKSLTNPDLQGQIAVLAARANPPNPFFDIPFLSAASDRLVGHNTQFLALTETVGGSEKLKFFAPARMEHRGFPKHKTLRIWSHMFAPVSTPLLDPSDAGLVVEKLAQAFIDIEDVKFQAVLFEDLNFDSAFAKAARSSRLLADRIKTCCHHERAMLYPIKLGTFEQIHLSGKRRQRLRRAMENLSELGSVEFETAAEFSDVMVRFEEFLLLESRGWKGRRGTSLHLIKSTAAFARQAVANMVLENRCRIYSLRLNGRALASLIVFQAGGFYYPWKTAFDETFQEYSAGVQLITWVNNELAQMPGFSGIDSLAADTNATANRFWPDRAEMGSLVIGLGANGVGKAAKTAAALERELSLKKLAKRVLRR